MILPAEYSWLEIYLDNDGLWLDDSINWDEVFDLSLSDITLYSLLVTPTFPNSRIFLNNPVKFSFLDLLLILDLNKDNNIYELYDLFLWDLTSIIQIKYLSNYFFFYTDYQDILSLILYYSPELVIPLIDYFMVYFDNYTFNYLPSAWSDLYSDTLNSNISEFVESLLLFVFYVWLVILFLNIFRIFKWSNFIDSYFVRFLNYFFSLSKETRIQFEALLQILFFFFFYWSISMATFDDDQEEFLEMFDLGCFVFFVFTLIYLIFKYSQHYFAFLELSVGEGRSVGFIAKQFVRDMINTFALLLRFFILLFRLNVYDGLDDFYDSYYFFLGDYDEDEYYDELFFSFFNLLFYDPDINDDGIYSLEEENEFFFDLFYIYFLLWGKFFTFIFFILEEILRLSLGFYICYLIIFDIHAVNASYVEDNFFYNKRKDEFNQIEYKLYRFNSL